MRKNRNRPESDEPLSEGRVEYLEAARQRVRNRRIRRTAVLEGVGGISAPLTDNYLVKDFFCDMKLPASVCGTGASAARRCCWCC